MDAFTYLCKEINNLDRSETGMYNNIILLFNTILNETLKSRMQKKLSEQLESVVEKLGSL